MVDPNAPHALEAAAPAILLAWMAMSQFQGST